MGQNFSLCITAVSLRLSLTWTVFQSYVKWYADAASSRPPYKNNNNSQAECNVHYMPSTVLTDECVNTHTHIYLTNLVLTMSF